MEVLFEIFMQVLAEVANNRKIPLTVRFIIASVICGSLIAAGILGGIEAWKASGVFGAIICRILALGVVVLWLFRCIKSLRSRK